MDDTTGAPLRVLTFSQPNPDTVINYDTVLDACTGDYGCGCLGCQLDKARRVKRGVRSKNPASPFRMRNAA